MLPVRPSLGVGSRGLGGLRNIIRHRRARCLAEQNDFSVVHQWPTLRHWVAGRSG